VLLTRVIIFEKIGLLSTTTSKVNSDSDPSSIILVFLFLSFLLSGFFSASEVALLSITEAKVRSLELKKRRGSHSLKWLKDHPDKLIITILIGNNLVNILATMLATVYVSRRFGDAWLGAATGVLTLVVLIFGEIIPKTLAQHHAVKFGLIAAPILRSLERVMYPIVWALEKLTRSVKKGDARILSEEELEHELLALAELGEEGGALEKGEKDIIENVLEFSNTTVDEVMTPRTKIDALDSELTLKEAVEFAISHSHSRLPVYKNSIDEIVGILIIRDLLEMKSKFDDNAKLKDLESRKPFFIPHTRKIAEAFKDFQRQKIQLAIVVDEHGGVDGLVTIEDLVEEVFGEIEDESDINEKSVRKFSANSWSIDASVTLEELDENTGIALSSTTDSSKTISLIVLEKLGRFPRPGEKVDFKEAEVFTEKIANNRIERVRVVKK
jgi:CBS domain containing-hemolysin-like protein